MSTVANATWTRPANVISDLQAIPWSHAITLTLRRPGRYSANTEYDDLPAFIEHLAHFTRRLDGIQKKRTTYWFGLSRNDDTHAHGVLNNIDLTHRQIMDCWTTLPTTKSNSNTDDVVRCSLGYAHIKAFNGNALWFEYILGQTVQGEVYTNVAELKS